MGVNLAMLLRLINRRFVIIIINIIITIIIINGENGKGLPRIRHSKQHTCIYTGDVRDRQGQAFCLGRSLCPHTRTLDHAATPSLLNNGLHTP